MSAERRPLLDIGLPQGSPLRPVLCFPRPPRSCDLNQVVAPSLKDCPYEEIHKSCMFFEEYTCWEDKDRLKRNKAPAKSLLHCWGGCVCRSARIATTILLANPAVKQQCLHYCVSAWRVRQPVELLVLECLSTTGGWLSAPHISPYVLPENTVLPH
ncbi:hypothetical protein MSG28_013454 [Choristoneura fumiferana]|uniref:Uncharacterized protein n=1 Tax=Choristoneura fumiferana TaxID=7141 RepID=A0ACC0KU13_CHOFU|nr:hypothetical protein MSG28_013454 [Choristoneura fumiferana]